MANIHNNIGNFFESVGYADYRKAHRLSALIFTGDTNGCSDLLSAKGTVYELKAHDRSKAKDYKKSHAKATYGNGGTWNRNTNPAKSIRAHVEQYIAKYDIRILVIGHYADGELMEVETYRGHNNIVEYLIGCAGAKGENGIRYAVAVDTTKAGGAQARRETLKRYGWTD